MFELREVTKTFVQAQGLTTVIDKVSYTFEKGISYAIMGPSGAGKSTFLALLAGFEPVTSGTITYQNIDVTAMARGPLHVYENFLQESLGLVFQNPCLIPELSIIENISIKGLISGMSHAACQARAQELLQRVGLGAIAQQSVTTLSGGQQQRIALARALFFAPSFLLLDEPTAHVDSATARDIILLLKEFQKKDGVGIIVVCHDAELAQAMDHILKIEHGRLHQ